jgi:beta-carotene 3-hydroxylase
MIGALAALGIVVATVVVMEVAATLIHRHVMHGWGWGWHKSHHEPGDETLERNDLYAVVFAGISALLFIAGATWEPLWWVGVGTVVYGVLYFAVHDGLVHQRWPFRHVPRRGYLKHLVQAHRLHHAVRAREGSVSFGFLFAPPLASLRARLRQNGRLPAGNAADGEA